MIRLANTDIKYLKGVGDARAKMLKSEMQISTYRDLLYTFPYRYVDRSRFYRIAEFTGDMAYVQVKGSFIAFATEGEGKKRRLKGLFTDGERTMEVVWFARIKEISQAYRVGESYILFGKPTLYYNTWNMAHPEVDKLDPTKATQGLMGIYSLPDTVRKRGWTIRATRKLVQGLIETPMFRECQETLPQSVVTALHLMPLKEAILNMHFPTSVEALNRAKERMKFEELLYVQLHILRYSRQRGVKIRGQIFPRVGDAFLNFYNNVLPFPLTGAQKRVVKEIHADMITGRQMNRLLQGDVGSGKTLVAFLTMLLAVDNEAQACLMAPTEILATQHYESLSEWCKPLGLNIALLKGSSRVSERRKIHAALEDGSLNILVGTHALIEDKVQFKNLGLAIIDEQHRFGVAQRAKLWSKNVVAPHMLVMTATPIPRTLAMTVYGDLDVSVIDELPPGRKPITTTLAYQENKEQVYRMIGHELSQGRQAYIVYPLIKENEKMDLKSLEEGYESILGIFGNNYKVVYVHGQMKPDEKDAQMQKFVSGEAQIMVATTVIEVGVNVPNATVMVIENAERFGLSQLHQLRGRVGRGADRSYCILVTKVKIARDTRRRLELMTQTTDGFRIAEEDMKMRGPGDMEGTLQSGLAFNLRVANLATDGMILSTARDMAMKLLDHYPQLSGENVAIEDEYARRELTTLWQELDYRYGGAKDWSQIS
jgi:ATP-dependent DNA helicase RecG